MSPSVTIISHARRVERVSDQHRHLVAEQGVRGAASAPELRPVDDVVVEQGRGVDELDDHRELDVPVARVAERTRGEQHQQRTQSLAAASDDVLGDLVHEVDVGRESGPNGAIDGCEVVDDESTDGCEVAKCRRRPSGKHVQCRPQPHARLRPEYSLEGPEWFPSRVVSCPAGELYPMSGRT